MKEQLQKLIKRTTALLTAIIMLVLAMPSLAVAAKPAQSQFDAYSASQVSGLALNANEKSVEKTSTTYYLGDVITDNKVTTGDAVVVLRYCNSMLTFSDLMLKIADANQDGMVNTGDATTILRICVYLEEARTIDIITFEQYNVSYDDGVENEDIEVPQASVATEGDLYTVDMFVPEREGYRFIGWNSNIEITAPDGMISFKMIDAGGEFEMPAYDVTLIAVWDMVTPEGDEVTVILNDVFNEIQSLATYSIYVTETVVITEANAELPDGMRFANPQSQTINVTDGVADCESITFNVYPYLMVGTAEYKVITTANGLNNVRTGMSLNYLVKSDIDMSTFTGEFEPIGWEGDTDVEFTGIFDGNDMHITNFSCRFGNSGTNVGIFAINNGTIKNIYLETLSYEVSTTRYGIFGLNNVGGIVGKNLGVVDSCRVNGNVGALNDDVNGGGAGGITGNNAEGATIRNCCMYGGLDGYFWVGGIVGKNFGTVETSWFVGGINSALTPDMIASTTELRNIGGIAGGNKAATISNCYSYPINYLSAFQAVGGISGWVKGGNIVNCFTMNTSFLRAVYYVNAIIGDEYESAIKTNNYTITAPSASLPMGFSSSIWDLTDTVIPGIPDIIANRRANVIEDIND